MISNAMRPFLRLHQSLVYRGLTKSTASGTLRHPSCFILPTRGVPLLTRWSEKRAHSTLSADTKPIHTAYIGLGSNLGDRRTNIQAALDLLDERGVSVVNTSQLYESFPMYVQEQPDFLNAVCCVLTTLSPHDLMKACQQVEQDLGRVKLVDKGARSIDLDVLLYDKERVESEDLTIPHKGLAEREFVYVPLSDITNLYEHGIIVPDDALVNYNRNMKLHHPFLKANKTNLMLIYNATPDSFSDGAVQKLGNVEKLLEDIQGVDIIDVGGQSTRPTSTLLGPEEELSRILPVIHRLRDHGWTGQISVDTFYASVAKAAIEAGADIINDVSGGQMDRGMLKTVAELGCPYIIMHARGPPNTMNLPQNLVYPTGVADGVIKELNMRYRDAILSGIRTWNIMLDPGISFSKNDEQNLDLLRTTYGGKIPWVLGTSRKGFIGKITGVECASQRDLGTAVTVVAGIQSGMRVVRVHEKKMREVVRMADALWKPSGQQLTQ